jgi:NADH-quinone oxidoreductase subunit E
MWIGESRGVGTAEADMMLSDAERTEIEAELAQSYTKRAAAIGAMRIVQKHRGGWLSDEALTEVAAFLEMTPAELDGIAAFYSLIFRRPVGEKVLAVCDSIACWQLGAESLLGHLEQRLGIKAGETTPDGEFTLIRICCLGDCDHAPAMMVNETQVREVTVEVLERIIAGELP